MRGVFGDSCASTLLRDLVVLEAGVGVMGRVSSGAWNLDVDMAGRGVIDLSKPSQSWGELLNHDGASSGNSPVPC